MQFCELKMCCYPDFINCSRGSTMPIVILFFNNLQLDTRIMIMVKDINDVLQIYYFYIKLINLLVITEVLRHVLIYVLLGNADIFV